MAQWQAMGRRFGLGVLALGVLGLTACASAGNPAAGGGVAPATGQPAPPPVHRLVFALEPPRLSSLEVRHLGTPSGWTVRPMYDYLLGINPESGKIEPGLLSDWAWEPDGQSLRVHLRKGIPFHGAWGEVKVSDVQLGWEQVQRPDSLIGERANWLATLKAIEPVDDREFVFRLNKPDGNFITQLSEEQSGLEVQSRANFDAKGAATFQTGPLAGSGPYQFQAGADQSFIRYERTPYKHWRVTPVFPEFEFRYMKEPSSRQAALLAGEVHMAQLPQDLLAQAEARGMKTVHSSFPGSRVFGSFECCYLKEADNPASGYMYPDSPLMDVRVRRAINKSVNRDELNKAFFGGKGVTMYVNHMYPNRPGWNPAWEKQFQDEYGYDPAAARKLLAEAGQSNMRTSIFVLPLLGVAGGPDLAEALTGYLKAVGIGVDLLNIDQAEVSRVVSQRLYSNHIALTATGANLWSGFSLLNSSLRGPVRFHFADPTIDTMLRQIQGAIDDQKRDALWRTLGDTAFGLHMNVNLFWLPVEVAVNPKVVSGWAFPGTITGSYTHIWYIKAAGS